MLLWVKYGLAVLCLLAVVPLFVWANTGRLSSARYALKRYMLSLLILIGPGALFSLAYWLMISP